MVMEAIKKVVTNLGASDIDAHLDELLKDGFLYLFKSRPEVIPVLRLMVGAAVYALG